MARAEPPGRLSEVEANEWRAVVGRMPDGYFPREMEAMLVQFCRHVAAAERLQVLIQAMEAEPQFNLAEYDKVLRMRRGESDAIAKLAKAMGIDSARHL